MAHDKLSFCNERSGLETLLVSKDASWRLTTAEIFATFTTILGLGRSAMHCRRRSNNVAMVARISIRPASNARRMVLGKAGTLTSQSPMARDDS
jgi:hypothetical protein